MVGCSQKEKRVTREHPSVKGVPGDALFQGFKDVRKLYPGPLNYFNNTEPKRENRSVVYGNIFYQDYGYDPKRARSDRNADIGLDIAGQERKRVVHVAGNTEYGRRWQDLEKLEPKALTTKHGHFEIVQKEFYRPCSMGIPLKVDDAAQVIQP
ncbi:hypothetical protein NP493_278g03003 [Ridgeia piscesae]|uniref:Uncharacterized protein n=1 Tax=Ridgeia piscesae TaxID=27915 RepID=A0AAD9NXC0_RIDPI|nr:hypothetical protein NP493_278g03003 [Ridgeia piscesae]